MQLITNNERILKDRRRNLRVRSTDVERCLWQKLRGRQVCSLKFFRQFSVGPYILDFYCPEKRIAVELDGSQHATEQGKAYDVERSAYLKSKDIQVIRFWNNEVITNMDGVVMKILEVIKA